MLSVAREGPNERREGAGRASSPSESACALAVSRALTPAAAFPDCCIKDGPAASKRGLYLEGDTLR